MEVFVEALIHQLLPFMEEITFPAILAFGYEENPPVRMAIMGAFTAAALLFVLGVLSHRVLSARIRDNVNELAPRLRPVSYILLLVVSSPAGFAIAFAAGLFHIRTIYALPLMLLGLCFQYYYQMS